MAITGTVVWTGMIGYNANSLAVYDNKLWVLTGEPNPNLLQPWRIRIYYTSDGTNWTEDTTWNIEGMDALFYDLSQLFIHQGQLHLLCNRIDNPGGIQEDGYIFRRQVGGGWVVVCNEATDSRYRYDHAYSNDAWIVIGGSYIVPSPDESTIHVWNGTTKTKELEDAAKPSVKDVIFYNGEWYASCSGNMIRNRGNGTWPVLRQTPPAWDGYRFNDTVYGLFNGELLWTTGGTWVNTAWPAARAPLGTTVYGYVMAVAYALFDHADKGKFYTYYNDSWTYRGLLNNQPNIEVYGFQIFKNKLYACGADSLRARVWRIEFSHDTTPGYWTRPTARQLVCDHETGDTIYFAIYDDNSRPMMMKIDDQLEDWGQLYDPSSGSFMQVQTALVEDVAYAFGFMGTDDQIQVTANAGATFNDCDDDWGEDKITTMEYLPTAGSDLTITNYEDEDLLRTTSGSASWTKRGDIPGAPLSQLRDGDNIFVGCTAGSANLYLSTDIGQTYTVKGTGLPINVDILDLELA